MADEKIVNTSTLSISAEAGSFATFSGPIVANQLAAAIACYKTLAHQFIQLLDVTSNIAGPNLVPVGAPAAHVSRDAALHTWNFTAAADIAGDLTGWSASADPIDSAWRSVSSRAANAPSIFLDRKIFGPFTTSATTALPGITMQNNTTPVGIMLSTGGNQVASYYAINARVKAVAGVRVQIFAGPEGQASGIVTVKEFTEHVARPLMEAYQVVLEKLHGRLKATPAPAELESALWSVLNVVTPDATQKMYEKLEILRDARGFPLYSPPTAVHAVRDTLVAGVVSALQRFPIHPSLSA